MAPTVYHLIGSPGVGKYTIGKGLAAATGARLVDNHAIANVIFGLIEQEGVTPLPSAVWPRVGAVRRAVLDTVMHVSPAGLSFVFTNFLRGKDDAETAAFEELVAVAEVRRSTFVPVVLSCETSELVRRIVDPSRRERLKLIDPVQGARFNDEVPPFETAHPNLLRLDVTGLPVDRSVRTIIEWAESRSR